MAMLATRERPAARDFVWPPPDDELDALEVVELRGLTPVAIAARPVASTAPGAPLAVFQPVPAGATVPAGVRGRARVPRLAAIASMMLFATMVGLLLGVRDARRSMSASYSRLRESVVAVQEYVEQVGTAPVVTAGVKPARPASMPAPARARTAASLIAAQPAESVAATHVAEIAASTATAIAALPGTRLPDAPMTELPAAMSTVSAMTTVGTLSTPTTLASRAPRAAAAVVGTAAVEARVKQALARYQQAYDTLDARAAAVSWPSVDVTALARAFANLKSQSLFFDRCTIDVTSIAAATATASCTGSTTAIRQVGSTTPVTRSLQWRFNLRRGDDDAWVIDTVTTSRP